MWTRAELDVVVCEEIVQFDSEDRAWNVAARCNGRMIGG
jgi:hypothetical protein